MARVLIVDDNEQNLYMLRVLLESNGHEVVSASNGAEALQLAARALPDLVITDILMPIMDGFAFCRRWKDDAALQTRPLVFYTATYTDTRDEAFAKALGADRFLVKPQEAAVILEVVRELLAEPALALGPDFDAADVEFLLRHNTILFHKLQKKVADLDEARLALERDHAVRHDLERKLFQAQKMEILGQIAGGLVHDFNNVLTVIGGFASLLMQKREGDEKLAAEWARKIQEAVAMGSGLSRQLMAFARKQDLLLNPLDLDELVQSSLSLIGPGLPSGLELVFRPSGHLPLVLGDSDQLKRVVVNLVANARDAMTAPGQLVVDTMWMNLDEDFVRQRGSDQPGRFVRVRFQDTGSGIAPEELGKIFDPLYTTKKAGQGTGLGLSVVYGIVHQHRGFLQVSSIVNRGTCIEVYLPAVPSVK